MEYVDFRIKEEEIPKKKKLSHPTIVEYGEIIRRIRMARGLSREELGKMVGLDVNRIQQYENGYRRPKGALLDQIFDVLNADVSVEIHITVTEKGKSQDGEV